MKINWTQTFQGVSNGAHRKLLNNNMTKMSAIIFMTCEDIFHTQQVLHVWCNIKKSQNGKVICIEISVMNSSRSHNKNA